MADPTEYRQKLAELIADAIRNDGTGPVSWDTVRSSTAAVLAAEDVVDPNEVANDVESRFTEQLSDLRAKSAQRGDTIAPLKAELAGT